MKIVVKTIGSRTCKYKFTSIKILFSGELNIIRSYPKTG